MLIDITLNLVREVEIKRNLPSFNARNIAAPLSKSSIYQFQNNTRPMGIKFPPEATPINPDTNQSRVGKRPRPPATVVQ